ncbi:serine/threonine-protein kinase [Amycolatopsis vastitatis]|uniref:non-specific serine/threonine protein kinase n=1 Tax=Amycolatopsis vastitatis TaxID=1905142 RepID=A0A229SQF2_9PSEU|nr:serine/threonine-protein kinase [Amycolatopsis vastitatis]OXM60879.1 serine/threonine protein kinase, bacterial [Amycolatopsis vastitatis]
MTACPREACTGTIGRTGYCVQCGFKPPEPGEPDGAEPTTPVDRPADTVVTDDRQGTDGEAWPPVIPVPRPAGEVTDRPEVPETERFCGKLGCGMPVGRSLPGQPGTEEGFCPYCGSRFSFVPRLRPGDRVAGRYEVEGCIGHGGLGFVYRATDDRLHRPVALKGLIDVNNTAAVRIAENESEVLVALEHPNIVRIFDVVTHDDCRYIVMEYVAGLSLREVKNRGRALLAPEESRLLTEHVVDYGREILTALAYLHDQGLLYCDMKPDNVIRGEQRIKLIDFGGIRRIDDHESPWVGTRLYQAPDQELRRHGLTVRSDVHTVGKTLRELFGASDGALPGARSGPIAFGIRSLRHVLDRATAPYEQRFATAREMLVQLDGVLNEIRSLRDREPRPVVSTLFSEPAVLLDAGLGGPPPLEHWTAGVGLSLGARPSPRDIALGLPVPREDPHDPQTAFLHTVRAPDAGRLLKKLERADSSVEVEFRRLRALLELSEVDQAGERLTAAERRLADRAGHDWRFHWHRGLIALAGGDVGTAAENFEAVYRDIPGEETPKLALGLCAEHTGEDPEPFYDALWVHRGQVNAAFGLARVALARGDRDRAVSLLDEVPEFSRHDEAARIAGVRVLAGRLPNGATPSEDELRKADERRSGMELGEAAGLRLRALLLQTAIDVHGELEKPLCGVEPTRKGLRAGLSEALRGLAWLAPGSRHAHEVLTDLANATRPASWI